jgi:HK97 family phage prohead protease
VTGTETELVRGGSLMKAQVTGLDVAENLRTIVGRAAPYNTWAIRGGPYLLSFAPGCFDKSIKEAARALPLMLFHDYESFPIGRASGWESRDDGLWGEWALTDEPAAQRAARLARDGVLTGLSVAWQPLLQAKQAAANEHWDPDDSSTLQRRVLKEGRLLECSLTPVPNFVDAGITHVAQSTRPPRPSLDEWKTWRASLGP